MKGKHAGGGGPSGNCVCLKCGATVPHQPGTPCREVRCPTCGTVLVREGSEHHRAYWEKKKGGAGKGE
jgi:DNA-directed RNA polymerase subunit RPC12/RpoP